MYGDMGAETPPVAELESDLTEPAYDDEESQAIAEAMPEIASDPARLSAFKLAIQMCVDRVLADREPASDSATESKGSKAESSKAPKGSLALIFGDKK